MRTRDLPKLSRQDWSPEVPPRIRDLLIPKAGAGPACGKAAAWASGELPGNGQDALARGQRMGRGAQGVVGADAREGSPVCEQVGTGCPVGKAAGGGGKRACCRGSFKEI